MNSGTAGSLNIFVAACVILKYTVGAVLLIPLMFLMWPFQKLFDMPAYAGFLIENILGWLVIAGLLAYQWWKRGTLEPEIGEPSNSRRYRLGHALILVLNLTIVIWFFTVKADVCFSGSRSWLDVACGWVLFASLPVAAFLAVVGAMILWSSRKPSSAAIWAANPTPGREARKYLEDPLPADQYCEKYRVDRKLLDGWINSGQAKAYEERSVTFVEDRPPPLDHR